MKKLLSVVLTVAMLLSMFAAIPVMAEEAAEETTAVDTSTLGDYYKFTFGENGDRYDYVVSTQNAGDTTGQVTYKDNTFYPLWNQSSEVSAWPEYKTITTSDGVNVDVLEIKATANTRLVPLTKDGKPFELIPGVKYTVRVKAFNPASNCWGQFAMSAGTSNTKDLTKVIGNSYKYDGTVNGANISNVMSDALRWTGGGIVGGSAYAVYLKDGSYSYGSKSIALSSVNNAYNEEAVTTSRYVDAYLDTERVVYIDEAYSNGYDEEKDSYSTKFAVEGEEEAYLYGNNYLAISFGGGNVMQYKNNTSYPLFTNATTEELDAIGTIPSCWQIESIEIASENFKSSLSYSVNGEIVKVVDSEVGTALEAFIPEAPEGKYFTGWYSDEAYTKVYTAEALEFGAITVYAKFSEYGSALKVDFDDNAYTAASTAVYYSPAGVKWPLTGYSWKGKSYDSQVNKGELKAHLEREGLSTEFPESTVAFYSDRTWGMPGSVMLANPDGTLFVPEAGALYRVTYKYRAPVHNGQNMSVNIAYGIPASFANATTTGDKTSYKSLLKYNTLTEAVTEWTTVTETITIPAAGDDHVPALGLNINGVKKVAVDLDGDGATDGAGDGFNYSMVELDYIEVVKVPTTTVKFVNADGSETSATVEVGAAISYPKLTANRSKDVVWSLSADEYVAAPKVTEEAITVYAIENDVIGFENYASADYIKNTLNLQVSEDYAASGEKSLKYENLGYSYSSAQPADWETNWIKYYQIVDGEIVQLEGEAAPEWAANTYLEHRGNSNTEQAIALWQLDGNKSYKVSFKYYIPEALAGDIEIYPYTNGSNIWWTQTDGNGRGKIDYKSAAMTLGADAQTGEWVEGAIYFTSTAIPSYDLLYVKVGTTAEEKVIVYFDDFAVEEVGVVTFEIPEGAILEAGGVLEGNIVTVYVEEGAAVVAPLVIDAEGNPIDVWYDENGNEVTEFVAGGAYSYQSFIYGDCNSDGAIDTTDLAVLKLNLAGDGEAGPGADCNGDGAVDTTDLAALKLFLAGAGNLGPAE